MINCLKLDTKKLPRKLKVVITIGDRNLKVVIQGKSIAVVYTLRTY